jgi:hypothetical protein
MIQLQEIWTRGSDETRALRGAHRQAITSIAHCQMRGTMPAKRKYLSQYLHRPSVVKNDFLLSAPERWRLYDEVGRDRTHVAALGVCIPVRGAVRAGRKTPDGVVEDVREGTQDVIEDVREAAEDVGDDVRRRRR